mmetsp:Transcript_1332/g.4208  ORF Transcript_1332/g.4208 Transcript_1332/m.4208 type:complete len:305 (+) Transcript_1332:493-1407(+)
MAWKRSASWPCTTAVISATRTLCPPPEPGPGLVHRSSSPSGVSLTRRSSRLLSPALARLPRELKTPRSPPGSRCWYFSSTMPPLSSSRRSCCRRTSRVSSPCSSTALLPTACTCTPAVVAGTGLVVASPTADDLAASTVVPSALSADTVPAARSGDEGSSPWDRERMLEGERTSCEPRPCSVACASSTTGDSACAWSSGASSPRSPLSPWIGVDVLPVAPSWTSTGGSSPTAGPTSTGSTSARTGETEAAGAAGALPGGAMTRDERSEPVMLAFGVAGPAPPPAPAATAALSSARRMPSVTRAA